MSARGPVIAVFDSGFGGLTVLRALLPRIPGAHYIYLGDTARLPYGAKSQTTIARYAVESARFLEQRGAEYLVIACNTATALALEEIKAAICIPVVGVIEPGAKAAAAAITAQTCHPDPSLENCHPEPQAKDLLLGTSDDPPEILVLATPATVQSHAYRDACAALHLRAIEKACPLLVPLVEEGWIDHPVTRDVLHIYLSEAFALTEALALGAPRAVLLGCTHYPLIAAEITAMLRTLNSQAEVIDSAEATAAEVARVVGAYKIQQCHPDPELVEGEGPASPEAPLHSIPATFECFATDSIEKFQRLGSHFLGQPIPHVELLDLGG